MTEPSTPQSRCCQAPVRTDGGPSTWFWRCTRCAQPCDAEPVPPSAVQSAKIRITSQHDFKPGEVVTISGGTGWMAEFNGTHVIGGGADG